jgi:putative Holliday junction resolvase
MIIMGIDWGRARIGVAISDELGFMAHPLAFLEVKSERGVLAELKALVERHRADEIVLGLPRNMDGTEGDSAAAVRRFAEKLSSETGRPVSFADERLTTWQADKLLGEEMNVRGKKRKRVRDQMAACLILQSHLDARKK